MCCTRLADNTGRKNRHLRTIASLYRAISSQLRHVSTIGKKFVKQQYLFQMSSQNGELRSTNSWDCLAGLGHHSKFQRVSRLGFVAAATSFTGGQPNFARCLAVSCAGTLYIHFRVLLPLRESCQVQTSHCAQVLRSSILLHDTRPVGVSQTLRRGTKNGITELSQTAPFIFGWAAITLGIGPHSSYI